MALSAAARPAGRRLRIGLIGHGTIGQYVADKLLDGRTLPWATLSAVLVSRAREPPPHLAGEGAPVFTADPEEFLGASWDMAVEAAGQPAVRQLAGRCLGALKRDFLVTSVGALCDDALHQELLGAAEQSGSRLLIAAGALPGMDWMASAALEAVEAVAITQTKRPEGWAGTPAEERFDLSSISVPTTIYEGSAREAATLFPKNANISAALALATVGLDAAQVRLVADPTVAGPTNRIELRGAAGELSVEVRGKPAFGSQRTSMVVPLSVVKAIRNLSAPVFIGV